MESINKTKYVLGIYKAKCYKLLMSSVFVVWLLNDINELELSFFCNKIFHQKGQIGKNMPKNLQHFALISHFCTF